MIRVHVSETLSSCEKYCQDIIDSKAKIIGLDIEQVSKNSDNINYQYCCTLQICVPNISSPYDGNFILINNEMFIPETEKYCENKTYTVYIFSLNKIFKESGNLPNALKILLRSKNIIKVGCDITTDNYNFDRSYGFSIQGIVDNQYLAISKGIEEISMNSLAGLLFNAKKYGSKVISGWDNELTLNMITYAAYDAYLSLVIYCKLICYNAEDNIIVNKVKLLEAKDNSNIDKYNITEALNILEILKGTTIFSGKKPPNLKKIVNVITNSYKQFVINKNRVEIEQSLHNYLIILHNEKKLEYDQDKNTIKLIVLN